MENAVESIMIAFAVIVFVLALSMTTYLLSKATTTTQDILYYSDKTNYLENLIINQDDDDGIDSRTVGIETVINSLYRYYKENFMVRIYTSGGELYHVFDTTIEGKVFQVSSKPETAWNNDDEALMNLYGKGLVAHPNSRNLFGAPWMGNTNVYAKTRVDLFVSGKEGYINNIPVDYTEINLNNLGATSFTETFIEYKFSGETISVDGGIETITGNQSEKNKIIIDYRANP